MNEIALHIRHHHAREPFIEEYLRHLREFDVSVIANDRAAQVSKPTRYQLHLLEDTVPPWNWGWGAAGSLIGLTETLPFRNNLNYARVSVIHAHFGPTGVWSLTLRRRLRRPLVTSFYGYDVTQHPRRRIWRALYRLLFRYGDHFLALGPVMRQRLITLGCPPEKVTIQPLGISHPPANVIKRPSPKSGDHVRILMVGRLVEKKGFSYGISAFGRVAGQFPQAELRIAGDGPLAKELRQKTQIEGLEQRVKFLGRIPREQVFAEMVRAHIFLAPSVTAANGDQEGTPTVILEAQAHGLPILSTYHADIPYTILERRSGYLVPERDVDALTERLAHLLANPTRWPEMGHTGRKHVEANFNIEILAQRLEALYQRLSKK
jgi:colanic acid/amylovoran biosynthesis glycosyltransferase